MTRTVIRGGTVLDRAGRRRADVVVDDDTGAIVAAGDPVDSGRAGAASRELDAGGCLVCPGLVDLNTHLRQPGFEGAETIDTAARSAALGGYTAIVAMPDTEPCLDDGAVVAEVLSLASGAPCEIVPAAAVTIDRAGRALAPLGELVDLGLRVFTDADRPIDDPAILRRAMEYLSGAAERIAASVVLATRPEIGALSHGGAMNEGEWSSRLGLPGRPAVAEELAVGRDLALARLVGVPLHVQQISTAAAVGLVRTAKAEGQAVTAEVSPHHLVLDESACATYDTNAKVMPPLRTPADVEAVRDGLLDGTIDAIATGHSPWPVDAKQRPFDEAPFGVVGLETALAVVLTELGVGPEAVLGALSWQPAAIARVADRHGGPIEPGRQANIAVVDPTATWTVDPGRLSSRSTNTAFAGRRLTGRVRHTILRGRPVVVDGVLAGEPVLS